MYVNSQNYQKMNSAKVIKDIPHVRIGYLLRANSKMQYLRREDFKRMNEAHGFPLDILEAWSDNKGVSARFFGEVVKDYRARVNYWKQKK